MYEIIVQGGGEIVWKCLNAIAMFSADGPEGFFGSLLFLSIYLCMVGIAAELVIRHDIATLAKKMVISLFLLSIMLLPSSKVLVTDTVTHFKKPVDHVPWLLAATASISSNIGHAIAAQFDLVFSDPGYPKYTKTGMTMYADLISKVSDARLPSMQQNEDMKNFMSQCVIYDLALGKYPLETLMDAPNVFEFINQKTSKNRGIVLNVEGRNKFVACNKVLDTIFVRQNYLKDYVNKFARVLNPDYAGNQENLNRWFVANMSDSYRYLTKAAGEAEDILKINMLRNVIKDWRADHSPDIAMAYAVAHAEQNQSFTFKSMGKSAGFSVPIIKIIIEVLAISLFPVVAVISLFHNGLSILKKYIGMFCWIQVWPLLFTVLNMVFVTYAQYKGHALTSQGLTLGNIGALSELNDSISAYAGYAMALVPFLSFMLVQGAQAFGQLSTSIIGATQSAVGSAANEAATGNYNLNTVRMDDHNRHNESGFKYDSNVSYAKDKQTWQQAGGELEHIMPNANKVLDRRPATSDLGATFNVSEGLSSGFSTMADEAYRTGVSQSQSSQEHFAAALSQYQNITENHRKGKDLTNSWAQGTSVSENSGFAKIDSASRELAKILGVDVSAANELLLGVNANGGLGFGAGSGAGFNAGGGARFSSDLRESTSSSHRQQMAEQISQKYDLNNAINKAKNEAKEGRYAMVDSEGNQYDTGIRANIDKSTSLQEAAQASFASEKAFRKSAQIASNSSVDTTQNLSQQVYEWGRLKYGTNINEILATPEGLAQVRQEFMNTHRPTIENSFKEQPVYASPEQLQNQYDINKDEFKHNHNPEDIHNQNKDTIVLQSRQKELTIPIDSDIPVMVENSISKSEKFLEEKTKEHQLKQENLEKEHLGFKENNQVTNYSNNIKNYFKSIPFSSHDRYKGDEKDEK